MSKAAKLIQDYLNNLDDFMSQYMKHDNMNIDLNDIARKPKFRGIHYKAIQAGAKELAKKGIIKFDGFNKITAYIKEERMKFKQYINEMNQKNRELFVLGRKVQDELNKIMITMTLRPKAKDFDTVAKKLGITKSKAIKAFNVFTWGGMDEATNMQVANTIRKQLGGKALFMLGAKNLAGGKDYLSFRIGRNSKGINYIKIKLTPMDLYDVEFGAIRGTNYKVKSEVKGIYFDQLHKAIEDNTGMYTSMGTMGR